MLALPLDKQPGSTATATKGEEQEGRITRIPEPLEEDNSWPLPHLIGSSPQFKAVLDQVSVVAPVDCSILVQGETGTGKEVIAKAIHEASPRRHRPFVAVNCAAIPSALLASELFGHNRGAFTGAVTQPVLDLPIEEFMTRGSASGTDRILTDVERRHIIATLREADWVIGGPNGAAARLGLPRTTLISRMRRLGIPHETVQSSDTQRWSSAVA